MIDKKDLCNNLLNGKTKEEYLVLVICAIIGLIASLLVELIRHKNDIKKKGGFSFIYWLQDNWSRMLLSVIIILIGVLYTQDLVGIEVGNKGALVMGFCTDKIIETIVSLKLTNVLSNLTKTKE